MYPPNLYYLENTTVYWDRQTAFLPRLKPGVSCLIFMKKTDLAKVLAALERLNPRVTVPEETAVRARTAIRRMLDLPR